MIQLTCIPTPVRLFLAGLRQSFRYRHFLVFSWLLVLQATHPEAGTLKELSRRARDARPARRHRQSRAGR